jgi:hypothetical protein
MNYRNHFADYASLRYKAMNATEKGAKGVIFTTPDSLVEEEDLGSFAFELPSGGTAIEVVVIRRDRAREIIRSAGRELANWRRCSEGKPFHSLSPGRQPE